ncbi:protein serine/threonine phosphatase 2C [Violaceomyces palustris]|uniref:Protein serine/threonine phosphatase 2C n=1 Tax=Violaceomyces palustris TaxID=1673888 RepID=A0ACD0NPX5_9BASI|nr:protein serine/threonine phosphatase 2C [Violaceomyces palustris]
MTTKAGVAVVWDQKDSAKPKVSRSGQTSRPSKRRQPRIAPCIFLLPPPSTSVTIRFGRLPNPRGQYFRLELKPTSSGVFGLSTSRGNRLYQEDTASYSCLSLPIQELTQTYPRNLSPVEPPSEPQEEIRNQVVWFGCFDGHGGKVVSNFLSRELHKIFETVSPEMVTDTVQYTREHGGYFRRFQGGILERWVRKEELKPVRASGPSIRGGRNPKTTRVTTTTPSQEGSQATKVDEVQEPDPPKTFSDLVKSARQATSSSSSDPSLLRSKPKGLGDLGEDQDRNGEGDRSLKSLIRSVPVPQGMEKESMNLAERLTLSWLIADRKIQSDPNLDVGGSTASVALLHSLDSPFKPWFSSDTLALTVAHLGDTRMLLCSAKDGKALALTNYHHPDDRSESERLRKMGAGMITDSFGEARWMGALANTRSFGDTRFKKVGLTAEPEVMTKVLRGEDFSFLIAFSDGVGGVMSDQEAVDLCRGCKHPSEAAERVLRFAEELGSEDNGTVMVIPLKAWGNTGGQDSTKERREFRRSKVDIYRDHRT